MGLRSMMLVPPVWFRVMNRRLLDYVGGDESRINFGPNAPGSGATEPGCAYEMTPER